MGGMQDTASTAGTTSHQEHGQFTGVYPQQSFTQQNYPPSTWHTRRTPVPPQSVMPRPVVRPGDTAHKVIVRPGYFHSQQQPGHEQQP
eukprot:4105103-Prorocentrum_lima.AAC.1